MKHLQLINQFREEITKLSREVELSVAMGHYDINKICEDVFCDVLMEIFSFKKLRNLNKEEKKNFPGIDLADDEAKVAIQVTSDKTLDKIKDSLTTFISHNLHKKYNRIIFYILTEKQRSYSQASINKICQGKVEFDADRDILDKTNLASEAAKAKPKNLNRAVDVLLAYMQGCEVGLAEQDFDPPEEPPEILSANLLEVFFPQTLYIAELLPDVFGGKKGSKPLDQRRHVGKYVRSLERIVPSDYEINGRQIITFHNLEDRDNPFSFLIDEGTVEPFQPIDYYSIDTDHESVFKSLLRFCMQNKLHKHRVHWQFEEGKFIFLPLKESDDIRTATWVGKKRATKTVFVRKFKNNKPDEVLSTRHFAFSVSFMSVGGRWYVAITPDWFFSYGTFYRASVYGYKSISRLKKMEHNQSVHNHFRFLCSWLKDLDSDDLFSDDLNKSPIISFGEILEFSGGRHLDEDLWEPLTILEEEDDGQLKMEV